MLNNSLMRLRESGNNSLFANIILLIGTILLIVITILQVIDLIKKIK